MEENFVLELLKSTVPEEIANNYVIKEYCIEITLPNNTIAVLEIIEADETDCVENEQQADNEYVYNHDYGEIGEGNAIKLLLRNLKDVRDYVIDVVRTNIIDVAVKGDFIKVANKPTVKIFVSIKHN